MNATSVRSLAVAANEKNRHSYGGNRGKERGGEKMASTAVAMKLMVLIKPKYRLPTLWLQWQAAIEGTGS